MKENEESYYYRSGEQKDRSLSQLSVTSNTSILSQTTSLVNIQKLDRKKTLDIIETTYDYICFNDQTSFPYVFAKMSDNTYESKRRFIKWKACEIDNGDFIVKIDCKSNTDVHLVKKKNVEPYIPLKKHTDIECFWYSHNYHDSVSIVMSHDSYSVRTGKINHFGLIHITDGSEIGPCYTVKFDFDIKKQDVIEDPSNVFKRVQKKDKQSQIPWHRDELQIAIRNYDDYKIKLLKDLEIDINRWLEMKNLKISKEIQCFYTSPPLKSETLNLIERERKNSYKIEDIENIIDTIKTNDVNKKSIWSKYKYNGDINTKKFFLDRIGSIISNVDITEEEKHKIINCVTGLIKNKHVNSEILLYIMKTYYHLRCEKIVIPDIYALCGIYYNKTRTPKMYFIFLFALVCLTIQICIPFYIIYHGISLELCQPTEELMIKLAGVMMYQTLFIDKFSNHLVTDLLPSYSFCRIFGILSLIIYAVAEFLIHILTIIIFLDEDEGRNMISFLLNALAMQYILKMNCLPYIFNEENTNITQEIKYDLLTSFILKSEKEYSTGHLKKIEKIISYCLFVFTIISSVGLGYCL